MPKCKQLPAYQYGLWLEYDGTEPGLLAAIGAVSLKWRAFLAKRKAVCLDEQWLLRRSSIESKNTIGVKGWVLPTSTTRKRRE